MQYSLFTIYLLYIIADLKALFFEHLAYKLDIPCNITAAICLLSCLLNKWIWKKNKEPEFFELHYPRKKENHYEEMLRETDQKRIESLYKEMSRDND